MGGILWKVVDGQLLVDGELLVTQGWYTETGALRWTEVCD